jgi:hypothetical protein
MAALSAANEHGAARRGPRHRDTETPSELGKNDDKRIKSQKMGAADKGQGTRFNNGRIGRRRNS